MIASFGDRATEALFHGSPVAVRRIPREIRRRALRKLDMLNAARSLRDMRSPPANRLERLVGGYSGFHSVRINDQWRLIFRWHEGNARDVRIVDYHS